MGKKQKMKKAAAKAVGAANSSTNISTNISTNNNNNKNNKNKNKNKKQTSINDDKTKDDNIQKLLILAEKVQAMPSGSGSGSAAPKLAKCHTPSSGSGSSATDSDDCETTKEYDSDDIANDGDSTLIMKDATNATVVDAGSNHDDNDDYDAITLVTKASAESSSPAKPEVVTIPKYSRGEKKARRLLMKLDLERIPNVSRVTMRKAKNVLLCMDQPDVYKCPHTKTLILFGEVRVEDTSNAAAAQAAERYLNDVNVRPGTQDNFGEGSNSASKMGIDDDEDDAQLDNGQLDEKDIQLVIMQSSCSRQKAIKALLKHNADVVNAIMELTIGWAAREDIIIFSSKLNLYI